jgi:DNA-binding HxlR family transcriptional regulator
MPAIPERMMNDSQAEILREIFQNKWRLHVLRLLSQSPHRLSQLRRAIPDASKKMIIDTLHGLEGIGCRPDGATSQTL